MERARPIKGERNWIPTVRVGGGESGRKREGKRIERASGKSPLYRPPSRARAAPCSPIRRRSNLNPSLSSLNRHTERGSLGDNLGINLSSDLGARVKVPAGPLALG